MRKRLRDLLILAGLALGGKLWEWFVAEPQAWIWDLLPVTLLKLSADHWKALGATAAASIVAWVFALGVGYAIALVVSLPALSKMHHRGGTIGKLRDAADRLGEMANKLYDTLYVVPVVITLSLVYAALMSRGVPTSMVFLGSVAMAGVSLGGYVIFKSLYNAVVKCKRENWLLIESLYRDGGEWHPAESPPTDWRGRLSQNVDRAAHEVRVLLAAPRDSIRLRDCEIGSHVNALELSLHLAIVAVIILETITPFLYELLLPQSGQPIAWSRGLGGLIINAQALYQFQIIAGCLWAIVAFDWLLLSVLSVIVGKLWLGHYRED